jgi:hypothetical protein
VLREIQRTQQKPDEPRRRWFFSHEMDLLMWFDEAGRPLFFQLCYGKYHDERALRWKPYAGFSHHRVNDGEGGALGSDTPMLLAGGSFDAYRVLERFRELAADLPPHVVAFVTMRLRDHPSYRIPEPEPGSEAHSGEPEA